MDSRSIFYICFAVTVVAINICHALVAIYGRKDLNSDKDDEE